MPQPPIEVQYENARNHLEAANAALSALGKFFRSRAKNDDLYTFLLTKLDKDPEECEQLFDILGIKVTEHETHLAQFKETVFHKAPDHYDQIWDNSDHGRRIAGETPQQAHERYEKNT
jgi:hypothetical protein